jgi:serine protease Do
VAALPRDFGVAQGEQPAPESPNEKAPEFRAEDLGLEVVEPTAEQLAEFGYEGFQGVLVKSVVENGPAHEAGLREGMLILSVGRTEISTVEGFGQAVAKAQASSPNGVLLQVRTGSGNQFVSIKP